MMKLLKRAGVIFDHINNVLFWLAAILLIFSLFSVCFEVFMRYVLNQPTIWAVELTEHALVWITFLGTTWLLKRDGHVGIDFLVIRLKPKAQIILNSFNSVLCAIICGIVGCYSVLVVWYQFREGLTTPSVMELPLAPLYIIIPIAFFLLFIQFLRRAYGYITKWSSS